MNGARPRPDPDPRQAAALLRAYLRLSLRRGGSGFGRARRRGPTAGLVWGLAFYLLMGLFLTAVAWDGVDLFTFVFLLHAITFVMVLTTVGLATGDVLLNPDEPDVLGFRPVSAATLLLAKGANLAVYALLVALAVNLVPMFAGLAVRGARPWFPLVHALGSGALAACGAGFVVLVYTGLARVVPRRWFDRAAMWTQIVLIIVGMGAFQLLPQYTRFHPGLSLAPALPWLAPLPPAWFAALETTLAGPRFVPALLALGLGGVGLSAIAFVAALRRLGAGHGGVFTRRAEAPARPSAGGRVRRRGDAAITAVPPLLAPWLRDPVERAAFRIATISMVRDREMMMRLYPAMAPMLIPLVMPLLGGRSPGGELAVGALGMFLLAALPFMVLGTLECSSQHAAAELFRRVPLADAATLFHGTRKAMIVWFMLPALIAIAALELLIAGGRWGALVNMVPGLLILPPATLLPGIRGPWVPLSLEPMRGTRQLGTLGWLLPVMVLLGLAYALMIWAPRTGLPVPALLGGEVAFAVAVHALLLARVRSCSRIHATNG